MPDSPNTDYEFKVRILGNEVFAVAVSTNNSSNRWVAIGLVTSFLFLTLLGVFGSSLVNLYHALVK